MSDPPPIPEDSGPQEASDSSGLESASRRRCPAPPPDDKDDDDSSQNSGNAAAVSGFVLSVIAVIPPAWVVLRLATVPASTLREDAGFVSVAIFFGLVFLLVPFEAIFGLLATILSVKGILRVKTEKRPPMADGIVADGIAGLAISLIALLLTISAFVLLFVRA